MGRLDRWTTEDLTRWRAYHTSRAAELRDQGEPRLAHDEQRAADEIDAVLAERNRCASPTPASAQ